MLARSVQGFLRRVGELRVVERRLIYAEDAEVVAQQTLRRQVVERRQQQPMRQVAIGAEQAKGTRRRRGGTGTPDGRGTQFERGIHIVTPHHFATLRLCDPAPCLGLLAATPSGGASCVAWRDS